MRMVVVCPDHNKHVYGELKFTEDDKDTEPLVEDLPDLAVDKCSILTKPTIMWTPDTSEMYCLVQNKQIRDGVEEPDECHLRWQIHVFGDEGAWLTYSGGPEHDEPMNNATL